MIDLSLPSDLFRFRFGSLMVVPDVFLHFPRTLPAGRWTYGECLPHPQRNRFRATFGDLIF